MPPELKIASADAHSVERRGDDLWVEVGGTGDYTDIGTQAENELVEALKASPWEDVVAQRFAAQNPWLYKIITDRGRSLFLDFLPLHEGGHFLDVGSGWGQVALPLARIGHAFCLDVSLGRLDILRQIAQQENVKLSYACGNYRTFPFAEQQFDLVVFNGSLEWIALGAADISIWDAQKAALEKARRILKPGGVVYIGIENAMGLKYLLGAPDDHTGIPNLTFLDESAAAALYAQVNGGQRLRAKTWSLSEYTTLVEGAGFEALEVYGCFPDYKLIRVMVPIQTVNSFLTDVGLPHPEHSGSDGAELSTNPILAPLYRLLAKNGIAQYFCPSYGLIARRPK
jgi:SAM-dependent methyltransferase